MCLRYLVVTRRSFIALKFVKSVSSVAKAGPAVAEPRGRAPIKASTKSAWRISRVTLTTCRLWPTANTWAGGASIPKQTTTEAWQSPAHCTLMALPSTKPLDQFLIHVARGFCEELNKVVQKVPALGDVMKDFEEALPFLNSALLTGVQQV